MAKVPVYVSNGAFVTRYNGRDYRLIKSVGETLHADGIEFLMYETWQDEIRSIRNFLSKSGLNFPVMHLDKQSGEILANEGISARDEVMRLISRDIDTAREIGSQKLVMHLWNGPSSDSRFDESVKILPEIFDLCDKYALSLTVENVTCKKNLSLDHLETIARLYPNARFTYDTKMAFLHDENALLAQEDRVWLLKEGYITHLHVNDSMLGDVGGGRLPIMHIGTGKVDFDAFFALTRACGFCGTATVESTSVNSYGVIDVDRLNLSLDTVRRGLNPNY